MADSRRPKGRGSMWMTIGVLALAGMAGSGIALSGLTEPAAAATAPASKLLETSAARRLNEGQYKQSIVDIFGDQIKVPGRFEPAFRQAGLLAIGDQFVGYSASGLEQNELRARNIAAQILSEENRSRYLKCAPGAPEAFDGKCAAEFLGQYGRALFRRPLTGAELAAAISLSKAAMPIEQNFYKALEVGLTKLIYSPNFVFRIETTEPDPAHPGLRRLTAYSLASRLSYLLWNGPPDEELLRAAETGRLHQAAELQKQVDRLVAAPRFRVGVRALFSDMLGFNRFDGLSKDQALFPVFTSQLAADAREQILKTIEELTVNEGGDYRDIFTTRDTFINRNLGALYQVPVVDGAGVEGWVPYTFDKSERRAGILTLAGILMLDPTHEGRSSPTNRGKLVREALLCQKVPDPPGNVDFSAVQDINSKIHRTARQRLEVHNESPVCAGCHSLTDPIGLSLENYDTIGTFRTHENEALIDASGKLDGKPYSDAVALGQILHDSPAAPLCLVQRSFEYGLGREISDRDSAWIEALDQAFAQDGYKLPALMRRIALSSAFRRI